MTARLSQPILTKPNPHPGVSTFAHLGIERKTWVWTYDDAGNILSKKEHAYTSGTLGSANSTITYDYGNTEWRDLLTSYNGKSFSYDTIGNLTSDGTWNYTWAQGRQLATMSKSGTTWTFTYDANGMRTQRTTGGVTYNYTYHGSQLTHMTYGSNSLHFYYDASGKPLSVVYNGTTYYYILSLQGDVVAILDSTGAAVVQYTYDAWGRLLSTTGSMAPSLGLNNPLRYRGYVYDQETGLYYLQSRYYNPSICRFISADSIEYLGADGAPVGYNLFAYCSNNPVNKYDPSGHSAILIAFAIGAILGGIYGGISAAANDQDVVAGITIGAVVGGLTGLITEVATVPLMLLGTFATGAGGDIASQMILDGKSFGEVNLISTGLTGIANAGLALVGKGLSNIDAKANLQGAEKIIFGSMTNSPLLGLGMSLNMVFSKNAGVYTVNDLLSDLLGQEYALTW